MASNDQGVNVCFIGNFYKTYLFHEVALKLVANGVGIFWIVSKKDQYDFLCKHLAPEKILYINRSFGNQSTEPVGDFKLNELIYGDRVLKHEIENGTRFLTAIQKPIYDFILNNKIQAVFGEITWAHEILILRMLTQRSELNCRFLQCNDIRIPNFRCAFFVGEGEFSMLEFQNPSDVGIIGIEKPKYLKLIDKMLDKSKSPMGRLDRIKRFLTGENIDKNDPNVIVDKRIRFKVALREEVNKSMYGLLETTPFEKIENEKFIFYGFHKQPEASIDVHGRYSEDQALIITNLWRLLPAGWKLVIKEHTNAVGDRSYGFYKRLLKYPNVILANEKIDSKLLIQKSQLVVTVSGTMAYEAALMQKPAATFARVFFNEINYCRFVTLDSLTKYESLALLVSELNSQPDNRLQFSQGLMKNTYEGYISDLWTDRAVMEVENVDKISRAFLGVIKKYIN